MFDNVSGFFAKEFELRLNYYLPTFKSVQKAGPDLEIQQLE
jgi:hypothetical protein